MVLAILNIRVQRPGISEVDLREVGCEDGRRMEVAQDRVQRRALVLALLNAWGSVTRYGYFRLRFGAMF